jgi:carbamoyl-phosphate synthase large subunit
VGVTVENEIATKVAINSVRAVSNKPHGIFGVDMAFDKNGVPNPTEINISRFFTTVLFFTKAGLNLPDIYVNIALHNKFPTLHKIINPLQDNLLWLRGMDVAPRLVTKESIEKDIIFL